MPPEISPAAALALPAPASLDVRLTATEIARTPARVGGVPVTRAGPEHGLRRVVSALGDAAGLLAVACAFPLVILAIGIPIALLVRLVMWLVGGAI